ncbi:carotenoid oxygenase family protein [Hyphococcus sp. DH-69]|uniref:carotenoid oxygenase family protein n=1 Tax=Hyphococcus formosus TaxID=3143534 RepID=UPI00398B6EE2
MSDVNLSRRAIVQGGAALVVGCDRGGPAATNFAAEDDSAGWMSLLVQSERGGRDYSARIEGQLPQALMGTLYRNGGGLYERDGFRKAYAVDGDGLIQQLQIADGTALYKNAFVKTPKFIAEENAGQFLYSTWTTRRPGGVWNNFGGGEILSQAGVMVYPIGDKIIALDEVNPGFRINEETLNTESALWIGGETQGSNNKAHAKFDPRRREWIIPGQGFGRKPENFAFVYSEDGKLKRTHRFECPRSIYFHDFLVTEKYFIFVLHPAEFSPAGFLLGTRSIAESLKWRPEKGNLIALCPREGGAPIYLDAPAAFMWHALNAYQIGENVIADFVGFDVPDHFIGPNPMLKTMMSGKMGQAQVPGKVRRYHIEVQKRRLREEIVDAGNHEFPILDPQFSLQKHRYGYFSSGGLGGLNAGVKRVDFESGTHDNFHFGDHAHVGEPIFVPHPDGIADKGWLIAQCLDGHRAQSFFAVFETSSIAQGPVAKIWLEHVAPLSFHGCWVSA